MTPKLFIKKAIEFAKKRNPIWPFASAIVSNEGDIICMATDCAHISPLYHCESLAIHMLVQNKKNIQLGDLSLYSTAEPDPLSQSTIHWANAVHELNIKHVYFGAGLEFIEKLWPFGIKIPAREIIASCSYNLVTLHKPILEQQCENLFLDAKQYQAKIGIKHPAMELLSSNVEDFYTFTHSSEKLLEI